MATTFDAVNNRVRLSPDGYGYNRYRVALPPPPSGTKQALYVMRFWLDGFASNFFESAIGFDRAQYMGLNFGAGPAEGLNAGYSSGNFADFCGVTAYNPNDLSSISHPALHLDSTFSDFVLTAGGASNASTRYFASGNGATGNLISDVGSLNSAAVVPYFGVPKNPAVGGGFTLIHQAFSADVGESVYLRSWINMDSVDLSPGVFDINNPADLPPDNPKATFPVSSGFEGTLKILNNGAQVGTNWRPSSGVMGFPTHFLAAWPFEVNMVDFVLDYLQVQYDSLA